MSAHTIEADYLNSDGNFQNSQNTLTINVDAATSTTVTSSDNPSLYGDTVTFTASVSNTSDNGGTPTGTVQFYIGSNALGDPVNLSGGVATIDTSSLSQPLGVGAYQITAVYTPSEDSFFQSSDNDATPLTQTVEAKTSTSVSSSENPSYYNDNVTFSATVTNTSGNGGTPTGSVQFYIGGTTFGTAVTLSNGVAVSNAINSLTVGAHQSRPSIRPPAVAISRAATTRLPR